jgi:hypothetical protein
MQKPTTKLFLILLFIATRFIGQNSEIDRLIVGELKMTFPSIYFKHNSTDYAAMPYSVDSCFKYIASHIKDINDFVIWRDSSETEKLSKQRIAKLKAMLKEYSQASTIYIESMGKAQKISRKTIAMAVDNTQTQYLHSLNCVFDLTKTRVTIEKKWMRKPHTERPRLWCMNCWKRGRFSKAYRLHLKQQKSILH